MLTRKSAQKLMSGQKLITLMSTFKSLSLMSPEYIRECCPKVLSGNMKLTDAVSKFSKVARQRKKESLVEKLAGFKSIENLRNKFPKKLTPEILDKQSDIPEPKCKESVVGGRRSETSQLETYVKSVVTPAGDHTSSLTPESSLRKIELQKDIKELMGFLSRAKSNRVKDAINRLVTSFQSDLA